MNDRAPLSARISFELIMAEGVALYQRVPPLGENIPVSVEPFPVNYLVPDEEEIECSVKRLCYNHYGEPSGMRAEHLRRWLEEARKAETETETSTLDASNLRKVV